MRKGKERHDEGRRGGTKRVCGEERGRLTSGLDNVVPSKKGHRNKRGSSSVLSVTL